MNDVHKECHTEFEEQCHASPELNCVSVPRTLQDSASISSIRMFVITEKAPTRAFF